MNLYVAGAVAAVLFGSGVSAAVFAPVIGANAQLSRKDDTINDLRDKLKTSQEAVKARDKAIRDRDAQTADNAATAASEAEEMAAMMKRTCKGAFDAGYASRRCGSGPAPAGVRDLRGLQSSGAFRSSGNVPAEPEGRR
jgi:hypothetical protein